MRRLWSLAAMAIVVLAVALPLAADSARSNYNKGQDAEKRQDYERAFEYYQEAFRQKPKDLRYRTAYEHTNFLASAAHVHRGQLLRDGGQLEEALGIIALESKTFWRPVTPNTIFVAADNPAKRKELDQSVIKTFYLSNLSQATELQDVVNAMRTLLEVQRIQQLQSQNAIIVRGTPDQIALAQKLVDDLDKAKPEVVIDVVVMQVSRDKTRTLGITP